MSAHSAQLESDSPPVREGRHPWLGLFPYDEEDREIFHGRHQEIHEVLRLIRREVLTVLFGRSGTGKSSLLKAGVFPQLRQEHCLPVWLRLHHAGSTSYRRQIRSAIEEAAATHGIETAILNPPVAEGEETAWEYFHRVEFWDDRNRPVTPILVFDQFEEFFTLGGDESEIGTFFQELADLVENYVPENIRTRVEAGKIKLPATYNQQHYKVMISLREDFVARLDSLRSAMPSVMHNRFELTRMNGNQALEVVLEPGGDLVNKAVAREIVRFVAAAYIEEITAEPEAEKSAEADGDFKHLEIEPALLSLVCHELNLQRLREHREKITIEQVRTSSEDILEDFYERSLEGLDPADRVFIEDRLVTASGFRTAVPVEEAVRADLTEDEIATLIDRRLIRKEDRLGIPHLELTHDVLTRVVTKSRQLRREREEMEAARLQQDHEEREKRRALKVRRARQARWIATGVAAIFAIMVVFLFLSQLRAREAEDLARKEKEKAERARELADARALALQGIDVGSDDPELALLLSVESAFMNFTTDDSKMPAPEIELAIRTAIRKSLVRKRYSGHTSKVYTVDFDTEGSRLLTGAWHPDATARVWNVESQREIALLDHDKTTVSCARFSPDGTRIVTATYRDGGYAYVWDATSLHDEGSDHPPVLTKPLITFERHTDWITCAAFSPDGATVATAGKDKVVRLWNPESGEEIRVLGDRGFGHSDEIRSVVFSDDGARILTASYDGTAILWDLGSGKVDRRLGVCGIIRWLTGFQAPRHLIFDAFAGSEHKRERLHAGDLSPSGKFVATTGNDRMLRVWDATTGAQLAARYHPDSAMDVAFIDEKTLVTACNDATIRFWGLGNASDEIGSFHPEATSVTVLHLKASQRGHRGWIRDVAVRPGGEFIATAGDDSSARLWKRPPGGEVAVLGGRDVDYWSADLHVSEDREVAYAGTSTGELHAWNPYAELPLENWGPVPGESLRHRNAIYSLSVSPDGSRLVTASQDQTAIVWDAQTGQPRFAFRGHAGEDGGSVYHARFSPGGKRIVTASADGSARIWKADDGTPELILLPGRHQIWDRDFEHAAVLIEKLKAQADSMSAFLWSKLSDQERIFLNDNAAEQEAEDSLKSALNRIINHENLRDEPAFAKVSLRPHTVDLAKQHPGDHLRRVLNRLLLEDAYRDEIVPAPRRVYDARFNPDGSRIVTADYETNTATIWDAADGRRLLVLPANRKPEEGHTDLVVGAAFSPDGKRVVTACMDGYGRIWDAESGNLVEAIPHGIAVRNAEYSPDGKALLTAAADGVARLWSVPGYDLRTELRGHTETVTEAGFSNDGNYIITAGRDGTARIFCSDPWFVYALATSRITRKLTLEERKQYDITRKLTDEERTYYRSTGELPASK